MSSLNTSLKKYVLDDGRPIFLVGIVQDSTYGGLLEGRICQATNEFVLEGYRGVAQRLWPEIECVVLGLDRIRSRIQDPLPNVHCTAHFISYDVARDREKMASALTVVWYQDEMMDVRSSLDIEKCVAGLDWNSLATDFDW